MKQQTEDIEVLRNEILERRKKILKSKIKKYRPNNFWASGIDECDRLMCYTILNWEDRQMFDEEVQARLDKGKQEEKNVIIELMDMGYDIDNTQLPIVVKNRKSEVICTGKLEGRIRHPNWKKRYVFEIKSMNPNLYKQIDTYDDLDKKSWLRKYKRQFQVYLLGHNEEMGLLILTDCLGHWKIIPVYLDYGDAEFIVKRLEKNWESVKKNKLPDRMSFKEEICGMCNFNHICLPDIKTQMAEFVDDKEIEADLEKRKELKPLAAEYDKLDKKVKKIYRHTRDVVIGINWRILTVNKKIMKFNAKLMSPEEKLQYKEETDNITVNIVDLRKIKEEGGKKK